LYLERPRGVYAITIKGVYTIAIKGSVPLPSRGSMLCHDRRPGGEFDIPAHQEAAAKKKAEEDELTARQKQNVTEEEANKAAQEDKDFVPNFLKAASVGDVSDT